MAQMTNNEKSIKTKTGVKVPQGGVTAANFQFKRRSKVRARVAWRIGWPHNTLALGLHILLVNISLSSVGNHVLSYTVAEKLSRDNQVKISFQCTTDV